MKIFFSVFTFALFFSKNADGCIATKEKRVEITSIERRGDDNFEVTVKWREYSISDGQPLGPETQFKFLEDDYFMLFQIVGTKAENSPPEEVREPLVNAMMGYVKWLRNNKMALMPTVTHRHRLDMSSGWPLEKVFDEHVNDMATLTTDLFGKRITPKEAYLKFSEMKSDIGIIHEYARLDGGTNKIRVTDVLPPTFRGVGGCSAPKVIVNDLGILGSGSKPAAAPSTGNVFQGFTGPVKEKQVR